MSLEGEAVLNIESAASFLGISTATVRNWVKCGYLETLGEKTKYFFHRKEVENIKENISNGNLEKLNKRANKSKADRIFIPEEYLEDSQQIDSFNEIIDFIKSNNIDISTSLFLICLNLLKQEKILSSISIQDIINENEFTSSSRQIDEEINSWLSEIQKENIKPDYSFLTSCLLPTQRDILGFIYQSILAEGRKSKGGSYYTPSAIVDGITNEYAEKDSKVLDPCCGTGQFLLAFADNVKNPANIYGIDIDEIAVRIARINLLLKYKDIDFAPNIVCKNTLFDIGVYDLFSLNNENIRDFDVIATNPPWGVHFSRGDAEKLKNIYPTITSVESFSYFLKKSIDLLRDEGMLSFILPESILNVKTHSDIRKIILENSHIKKISYLDRVFKNVFTSVIRLDLKKGKDENKRIIILKDAKSYEVDQARWLKNKDLVFDIRTNSFDAEIIDKIYAIPHATLAGKADWALGIVTGSNKKYITNEQRNGFEAVYKGKDVEKFILSDPSNYIQFSPEKFQQVAPTEKYRAKEKLIYRFISKNLVFAYDDKQKLTLNSANIVIPKIPDYPLKVIAALFNSSLYQFIFQKKFSSIKVLRSHIEQMPLPLWDKKTFSEIVDLVDEAINDKNNFEKLDNYIIDKFLLSPKEKDYIKDFKK